MELVPSSMPPRGETVEDEKKPSSNTPDRNPKGGNDQPGQRADTESTSQHYTVYHIMKHVCNDRQQKYVVSWWWYTSSYQLLREKVKKEESEVLMLHKEKKLKKEKTYNEITH